ncbi:PspC domain-containing protein [Halalkalibacter okhensis]|uniref:PspC domain-containing protein n=1 Tax=Halalkalibacter okhensis TaxID=333138 RepID=UPI0027E45944|nr:PspC domain-containing protein [Halalkalibacter okhensis]
MHLKHRKLRKSSIDKSISGVCGGIAEFFGISSFFIRLIFVLFLPVNLLIYIILVNTLPDSPRSL